MANSNKGRNKALEWLQFEEIFNEKGIKKQQCIHCSENISSKVERIREHLKKCTEFTKKQISDFRFEDNVNNFGYDTYQNDHALVPMSPLKRSLGVSPMKRSASVLSDASTDSSYSSLGASLTPKIDRFIHKTTDGFKKLQTSVKTKH